MTAVRPRAIGSVALQLLCAFASRWSGTVLAVLSVLFVVHGTSAQLPADQPASAGTLRSFTSAPSLSDTTRARACLDLAKKMFPQRMDTVRTLLEEAVLIAEQGLAKNPPANVAQVLRASMAEALKNIGRMEAAEGDHAAALTQYQRCIDIRNALGDITGLVEAYELMAKAQRARGDVRSALDAFQEGLELRSALGDELGMAVSHTSIGSLLEESGDIPGALEQYQQSLRLRERIGDRRGMAVSYNSLAGIHIGQGDMQLAKEYYTKSLRLREATGDRTGMAGSFNNLAFLHYQQGDTLKALQLLEQSLEIYTTTGNASGMAGVNGNIGSFHRDRGDDVQAMEYFKRSRAICEASGDMQGTAIACEQIAGLLLENGHIDGPDGALELAQRSLQLGQELGFPNLVRDAAYTLDRIHRRQGRFKNALAMYELHIQMRDSILSETNQREAIRSALQRDFEERDAMRQADVAKKEALATEVIRRKDLERNATLFGFVLTLLLTLTLVVLVIMIAKRRERERQVAMLEHKRLEQEGVIAEYRIRDQVGRDMHDDLGAGLSALKLRSEMALRKESDPAKKKMLGQLAATSGELIVNMRQIIWTLNEDQRSLADLLAYLGNYVRNYLSDNELTFELIVPEQIPAITLSAQARRNLLLVVKEALHNVVKHAQATHVKLVISCDDDLNITITDNGIGLQRNADLGVGNGLRNMARRMEVLGGSFGIEGQADEGTGTQLLMLFPLPTNKGSIAPVARSTSTSRS